MRKETSLMTQEDGIDYRYERNIDMIKVVSAFLVCYSHFNSYSTVSVEYWFTLEGMIGYLLLTMASYGVPLFLLINGYLTINKVYSLEKRLRKAFKVIFITFLWGIIYNITFSLCFGESKTIEEIVRILYQGAVYQGEYISIRNWYFWALGIIYLLLPFIDLVFQANNFSLVKYLFDFVFLFTIGANVISRMIIIIYFYYDINWFEFSTFLPQINIFKGWNSFVLAYFLMGGIIKKYWKKFSVKKKWLEVASIVCPLFVMLYGYLYMNGSGEYYNIVWNSYPSVSLYLGAVALFVLIIKHTNELPEKVFGVIENASKNTMGIYFVHLLVGTLLKPIYLSLEKNTSLVVGLIYSLMVFIASNLICEILKKVPILNHMVKL